LCTLIAGSHAPAAPARFWAKVLDWQALYEANHEVVVGKGQNTCPRLVFVLVPGAKSVKNQLHIDLASDDRHQEVTRLLELGARRVDGGQGRAMTWLVIADFEGNEFGGLRTRG
jgi:hypothetical protein